MSLEAIARAAAAGHGSGFSFAALLPGAAPVVSFGGFVASGTEIPVTAVTLFDLASLTKVFTAVAALSLVDDGLVDLDAPVIEHVPVASSAITLRHLLVHTAGLPPSSFAWQGDASPEELLDILFRSPLESPPGERHQYSCLGYIAAGRLIEQVSSMPLDRVIRDRVLSPLGVTSARFAPVPVVSAVATELQPHRGLVHGEVHDELAHALARPVGNAGLFGTADDVLALGEMILGAGVGRVGKVLSPASLALMTGDSGAPSVGFRQAVGARLADSSFMGCVDGVGHTGFTGTSLVVDRSLMTATVLLTNRVNPTRVGADVGPARRRLAEAVASVAGAGAG